MPKPDAIPPTAETFTERFRRLTDYLDETELAFILKLSVGAVRKLRDGTIQSLKLEGALRLASKVGVSPYYLGGMREPLRGLPSIPGMGNQTVEVNGLLIRFKNDKLDWYGRVGEAPPEDAPSATLLSLPALSERLIALEEGVDLQFGRPESLQGQVDKLQEQLASLERRVASVAELAALPGQLPDQLRSSDKRRRPK